MQQPDYCYQLTYNDGAIDCINIVLDESSGDVAVSADFSPPAWAQLDHHQCQHCTLQTTEHRYCPIARNLAFLFSSPLRNPSHEPLTLTVTTPVRSYSAETTLQRALGSLFGLVGSLSPCPHTRPLKPMGTFHLPLATETETLVRATAYSLLKQYLRHQRDDTVPVNLDEMTRVYSNLKTLNRFFVRRLQTQQASDAAANAIILLDVLARDVDFELESQLETLQRLFAIIGED